MKTPVDHEKLARNACRSTMNCTKPRENARSIHVGLYGSLVHAQCMDCMGKSCGPRCARPPGLCPTCARVSARRAAHSWSGRMPPCALAPSGPTVGLHRLMGRATSIGLLLRITSQFGLHLNRSWAHWTSFVVVDLVVDSIWIES